MTTMKSHTDLPQSKKLAKILPPESADMVYIDVGYSSRLLPKDDIDANTYPVIVSCWSLAALIDVISKHSSRFEIILRVDKKYNIFANFDNFIVFRKFVDIDNAIDVCVDMIETLHEQKMI